MPRKRKGHKSGDELARTIPGVVQRRHAMILALCQSASRPPFLEPTQAGCWIVVTANTIIELTEQPRDA